MKKGMSQNVSRRVQKILDQKKSWLTICFSSFRIFWMLDRSFFVSFVGTLNHFLQKREKIWSKFDKKFLWFVKVRKYLNLSMSMMTWTNSFGKKRQSCDLKVRRIIKFCCFFYNVVDVFQMEQVQKKYVNVKENM